MAAPEWSLIKRSIAQRNWFARRPFRDQAIQSRPMPNICSAGLLPSLGILLGGEIHQFLENFVRDAGHLTTVDEQRRRAVDIHGLAQSQRFFYARRGFRLGSPGCNIGALHSCAVGKSS